MGSDSEADGVGRVGRWLSAVGTKSCGGPHHLYSSDTLWPPPTQMYFPHAVTDGLDIGSISHVYYM